MTSISDETNKEKIERKSKKNIALGTIFGYLAIFVSLCYGFFVTPEIIKHVGDQNYGLYSLSTSIINLFLMDFGLAQTINTKLAKLRAANDKEGVERFLAGIFKMYLIVDAIFAAVIIGLFFATPYAFKSSYTPDQLTTLSYLFIVVGGYSLISLPSSVFNGVIGTYEKFGMIKVFDIIQKLAYLGLSLLSIFLGWGIIGIVCVNVASGLFAIALRFLYMRAYLKIRLDLRKSITKAEKKDVLSFSAWGFVIVLCTRLLVTITPFILASVSDALQVTLFGLIATIESYVYMFGEVFSGFFMAKIARTEAEGTEEEKKAHLQALIEKIGKLQFFVIGLILAGFVSVGYEFVCVWMREEGWSADIIRTIYLCIIAVCAHHVIDLPQIPVKNAMYLHNHIKPLAIAQIIKAVVNVGLSFWLSYRMGAFGACLSILIANSVGLVADNFMYKKYLGISLSHYFLKTFLRGAITFGITIGVGLGLHFFLPLNHHMVIKLFIDGGAIVLIYIICSIFITFDKEERKNYLTIAAELLHIKKKAPKAVEKK